MTMESGEEANIERRLDEDLARAQVEMSTGTGVGGSGSGEEKPWVARRRKEREEAWAVKVAAAVDKACASCMGMWLR